MKFRNVTGRPQRTFCAPYVYASFPPLSTLPSRLVGEEDPIVAVGPNVPVYSRPSIKATITGRLNYDLVLTESIVSPYQGLRPQWIEIRRPNGRRGFVEANSVRSHWDSHACVADYNGEWLISEFEYGIPF